MKVDFSKTLGQEQAKNFLSQAVAGRAFPHALLVHGERGLGQTALLLDLARILLCDSSERRPCGQCRWCRERESKSQDNLLYMFPMEKKTEENNEARIDETLVKMELAEKNPYSLVRTDKEHISINRIRQLQGKLAYAEHSQRVRVVLVFWAESMQHPAANSLLKVLEEPPANTYFLLGTENRSLLLPTILSRCSKLSLSPLSPFEMMEFGSLGEGVTPESGKKLLPFCEGSPGLLLDLASMGGEELLEAATAFISSSLNPDWMGFSGFLEASPHFEDMESALRILEFVLRMVRIHHRLGGNGLRNGIRNGLVWKDILTREGFDAGLEENIRILDEISDMGKFVLFVENTLLAIRQYSKPRIAVLGNFLEYEMMRT